MASWTVSQARKQFSDLLEQASDEPQLLTNHQQLAGAVIGKHDLELLQKAKAKSDKSSIADAFSKLRERLTDHPNAQDPILVPTRSDRDAQWQP